MDDESFDTSELEFVDEEDQIKYEKAVRMHCGSKIPNSALQNSCFEVFLRHADRFVSLMNEEHQFNIFDQLPSRLKLKFLDFILSKNIPQLGQLKTVAKAEDPTDYRQDLASRNVDSELRCAFLKMILEKQPLKILDLEKIIKIYIHNKYNDDSKSPLVLQIVAQVVADSPDLAEFKCNLIGSRGDGDLVIFGSPLLDRALRFGKLRVLELRGTADKIDDLGLQAISSHLPHLTTLSLTLDKSLSRHGLSCLSALTKLREFSFIVIETNHDSDNDSGGLTWDRHYLCHEKTREIFEWCAEDVAQLQEINAAYGSWKCCGPNYRIPSGDFHIFADPTTCRVNRQVSQLQTVHAVRELPSAQFPDLKTLKFSGPISNLDTLLARCLLFSKLTCLELFMICKEEARLVLKGCGRGLTRLVLMTSGGSRVDDRSVLALCPNLVSLSNHGYYEPENDAHDPDHAMMMTPMEHLVKVKLDFLMGPAPANCLPLMLASPVIESVCIGHLVISAPDFRALSAVGGPTLKYFSAIIGVTSEVCSVDDLERMVRNVVCNSENLKNIFLEVVPMRSHDYFKSWSKNVSKFLEIFKSRHSRY